jgi:hypothetical protein
MRGMECYSVQYCKSDIGSFRAKRGATQPPPPPHITASLFFSLSIQLPQDLMIDRENPREIPVRESLRTDKAALVKDKQSQ